MPFSIVLLI